MKYLSKITIYDGEFKTTFANGVETTSHDAACFFQIMQEKNVSPGDLASYIHIGELAGDMSHDWPEIKRIAATFTQAKGAAA